MFDKFGNVHYKRHTRSSEDLLLCTVVLLFIMTVSLCSSSMAYAAVGQDVSMDANNVSVAEVKVDLKEAKGNPELTKEEKDTRQRWLENTITKMRGEKKTWEEIAIYLKDDGIELITFPESESDTISPLSTGEDVTMYRPSIIYDSVAREYIIIGEMEWKRPSSGHPYWFSDLPMTEGNVGGYEGVGIEVGYSPYTRLERYHLVSISYRDQRMYTYTNPEDWDPQYGVTFKPQDRWWMAFGGPDYSFHRYMIYTYWTVSQAVSDLPVKHRYAHTWSSTGVTAAQIGYGGISFTFSSQSNRWSVVSPPCYWTI